MLVAHLEPPAVTRALAQIADRSGDTADLYLERREEVELPADDDAPGYRVRREAGLAVRLQRGNRSWLATGDDVSSDAFSDASRRVARALPHASYPRPAIEDPGWDGPPEAPELATFPTAVLRALRGLNADVPIRLRLRRIRRSVQTIGSQLASGVETETFYSFEAHAPDLRTGALLTALDEPAAADLARSLARRLEARETAPPEAGAVPLVLGAAAAAVLLHEAVAHALEADVLAAGGHPETAIGVRIGSEELNVFDDPARAPESVRRHSDDEGYPVSRRCLLRRGVVEQPLCDLAWARRSELLVPGAGRRGSRHHPPAARSHHLVLVPGEAPRTGLFEDADGGLYLPEVDRGQLDVARAVVHLRFPWGQRIRNGVPGPLVGPFRIRVPLRDLLASVAAVASEERTGGAGWCAKGGMLLPVWATSAAVRLRGVEVAP